MKMTIMTLTSVVLIALKHTKQSAEQESDDVPNELLQVTRDVRRFTESLSSYLMQEGGREMKADSLLTKMFVVILYKCSQ